MIVSSGRINPMPTISKNEEIVMNIKIRNKLNFSFLFKIFNVVINKFIFYPKPFLKKFLNLQNYKQDKGAYFPF